MKGHEYARAQVRNHLAATVPTRLRAIRQSLTVATPLDPASYLLADGLPTDPALYPAVVIMSTGAPVLKRQTVQATGHAADFIVIYALRVIVATRTDTAGGDEEASRDRDRLLLAVRESLLAPASFADDLELFTQDIAEETGAAAQDLRGRPLAAGQITCQVGVLETLAPVTTPAAVADSEIAVTGKSADTTTL